MNKYYKNLIDEYMKKTGFKHDFKNDFARKKRMRENLEIIKKSQYIYITDSTSLTGKSHFFKACGELWYEGEYNDNVILLTSNELLQLFISDCHSPIKTELQVFCGNEG